MQAVLPGVLIPPSADAQASSLSGEQGVSPQDASRIKEYAKEELEHLKQQRVFKHVLFWSALGICFFMVYCFTCLLMCIEPLKQLVYYSHFAVLPVLLCGTFPLVILIFLLKSIYPQQSPDALGKKT